MSYAQQQVLQISKDPDELMKAARAVAQAPDPEGHRVLHDLFQNPDFYARLDSKKDYGDFGMPLRLQHVLTALSDNDADSAHGVLVALTKSPVYKSVNRRILLLITACAAIRPAPPEVVQFWDEHCQPVDGFTPSTIEALVVNGSPPALELLEQKMADPEHDDMYKIDWMHRQMLEHRYDVPLLESCLRMLQGSMPEALRPALVESLFDYRPREWFPGKRPAVPEPPARATASDAALEQLRVIGEYALENVQLTLEQRKSVKEFLEQ